MTALFQYYSDFLDISQLLTQKLPVVDFTVNVRVRSRLLNFSNIFKFKLIWIDAMQFITDSIIAQ
jgi:hypothetical protein